MSHLYFLSFRLFQCNSNRLSTNSCISFRKTPLSSFMFASPLSLFCSLSLSLTHSLTPSLSLNPSASCRSVRLPVSVPIRFHLIHVTSINTQSSSDKSHPLSLPLRLSTVAVHHPIFSVSTYTVSVSIKPNLILASWKAFFFEFALWRYTSKLASDIYLSGKCIFCSVSDSKSWLTWDAYQKKMFGELRMCESW